MFSPLSYGRMFSCENDRGTLGVSSIVQCIILPPRNKSLPRNPFEFLHIRESLVSRTSRLDPRDPILETRSSNVSSIEARGLSLEVWVSSVNLLLSGTVWRKESHDNWRISTFFQTERALKSHMLHKWRSFLEGEWRFAYDLIVPVFEVSTRLLSNASVKRVGQGNFPNLKCYWNDIFVSSFICSIYSFPPS